MPEICPFVAIGMHLLTTTFRTNESSQLLFEGCNAAGTFSKWLKKSLHDDTLDKSLLGALVEDLGTHSIRKGVVTYVLSFPGGPSSVAAYLRANWSLGPVQMRYIFEGEGTDQMVGRTASGLPLTGLEFATLPPHFQTYKILEDDLLKMFCNYQEFPDTFKECLPLLVASIVYHSDYLKRVLEPTHPLFRNHLFTKKGLLDELKADIIVGSGYCPATGMKATGIPPHIVLCKELQLIIEKNNVMLQQMGQLQQTLMSNLPSAIGDHILSKFVVNGAIPVTVELLNNRFEELKLSIIEEVRGLILPHRAIDAPQETNLVTIRPSNANKYDNWSWGGVFWQFVPENYRFPGHLDVHTLWNWWYFGTVIEENESGVVVTKSIRPFRMFKQNNFKEVTDGKTLNKARRVVRAIATCANLVNVTDYSLVTLNNSNDLFNLGYNVLIAAIVAKEVAVGTPFSGRHHGEIAFTTLYNVLDKYKMYSNKA